MKRTIILFCWCLLATSCFSQNKDHEGRYLFESQGMANWGDLENDNCVEFVYLDASTGGVDRDLWYEYNLRNARRCFIPVGSAHHLTSNFSIACQAENFKGAARYIVQDLVPMLVIDEAPEGWSKKQLQDSLLLFVNICKRYYGKYPMICANERAYKNLLSPEFELYHICLTDCEEAPKDSNISIWSDKKHHLHLCRPLADFYLTYPREMYFADGDDQPDGIDVSKYQSVINWDTLATANLKYAIIRASLGVNTEDSQYERNVREARRVGLLVGAYHFLSTKCSARDQFFWFYQHVKRDSIDLPPMLDVEESKNWKGKQLRDSVNVWISLCEKYYGVRPIIYTYQYFYNDNLAPYYDDEILFLAKYKQMPPTTSSKGSGKMWQYSSKGKLPGIDTFVDLSKLQKGFDIRSILLQEFTQPTDTPVVIVPQTQAPKKKKK